MTQSELPPTVRTLQTTGQLSLIAILKKLFHRGGKLISVISNGNEYTITYLAQEDIKFRDYARDPYGKDY